ncbi:hypothetical protein [Nocardia sp. NPDC050710]|uniref:hypothetical protein n=1 Tax=Nocardia sp. NPDC050710 TaxID=3157220 RepID=UPI0033D339E9
MTALDGEQITLGHDEYRITYHADQCASNPREDRGHRSLLTVQGHSPREGWPLDEIDARVIPEVSCVPPEAKEHAVRAVSRFFETYGRDDSDRVERAYAVWHAISASPLRLFTGSVGSRAYFALAHARADADAEAREYVRWADGEVFGWILTGPDGEVASCWGYYDLATARGDWHSALRQDWLTRTRSAAIQRRERHRQARSAGAGFIGAI